MDWPKQAKVIQVTARNATLIRKAFDESIDVDAVVAAWDESHPDKKSMTTSMARSWALANVHTKKKPLEAALSRLYADGYTLGDSIARSRLLSMVVKSVSANVVDWSTWTPGMESSAALVRPTGGLQELLRTRKIQVTDEVLRTKLDRIGTKLADSLERGYSAERTASAIRDVVNDPQHALMIARTEMARSMSVATRDTYEKSNVEQVEWLVAEGCEDCQENADASPIGIDETFPSGDSEPPAHPNCMCALAPVFDDSNLPEAPESEVVDAEQDIESVDTGSAFEEVEQEAPVEPEFVEPPSIQQITDLFERVPKDEYYKFGDNRLGALLDMTGYDALPTLVNDTEMAALVDKGWVKVYRGLKDVRADEMFGIEGKTAQEMVAEFKTGKLYPGLGIYGNGTYTTSLESTAGVYAQDHKLVNMLQIAISPDAKIADYKKILAEVNDIYEAKIAQGIDANSPEMAIYNDVSKYAIHKGYDAVLVDRKALNPSHADDEKFYIILNRGKVAVAK